MESSEVKEVSEDDGTSWITEKASLSRLYWSEVPRISVMFTGWVVSEKLRCGRPAGGVSTWLKGREPSVGGWKKFREAVTGPEGTVREMAIVVREAWEGMVESVIGGLDGMVR